MGKIKYLESSNKRCENEKIKPELGFEPRPPKRVDFKSTTLDHSVIPACLAMALQV
jgi:hypothetical protein